MSVYATYDTQFHTWNIMCGSDCVYYTHDADTIDTWLSEHPEYICEN